jgi:hypothetical protein
MKLQQIQKKFHHRKIPIKNVRVHLIESSGLTATEFPNQNWRRSKLNLDFNLRETFDFISESGLKMEVEHDPLNYLQLFLDNNLIEEICSNVNLYATQSLMVEKSTPNSRSKSWEPFWVFLGVMMLHHSQTRTRFVLVKE